MKNKINKKNITIIGVFIATCILLIAIAVGVLSKNKDNDQEMANNDQKGTLVINTDRSHYSLGDNVFIQITALDANGKTDCESELEIAINDIEVPAILSPTCGQDERTSNNPDFYAYFRPESEGSYTIILKDLKSGTTTETEFIVGNNLSDITITRWGPTKINSSPNQRYPMKLTITANKDLSGQVVEQVPNSLEIEWNGPAKVDTINKGKTLTWDIELKKDEVKELIYEYNAPQSEVRTYDLGKAKVTENGKVIYEEDKTWTLILQNI